MITQSINLNLVPGGVRPIINVSQYDKGSRTLQIVLFNGVTAYQIPDGASVTIQGTKADKTGFQYEVDSYSGNVVTTDIEQQMTVFPGDVAIELSISKNGDRLGTANFILRVEPAALADDTIISETELPLIEQAVEIAEHISEYVQICEDSATAAAASASTANTKAGEASASATSAAGSATSASGSATAAAGSATAAAGSASSASDSATAASGSATSASGSASAASTSATNASGSATSAAASATTASSAANEAHGWCDNNGDSGQSQPSATNNAYYWYTQAQQAAGGGVSSFNGRSGAVLPAAGDYDATQVYYNSNTTVKAAIDGKANVNTTLAGYGITDAYTKTETDTLLSGKQGTLTAGANVQINGNTISATDTTYSEATTQAAGLMSAADKTALNGAVSDISDLETAMGNTDISGIGDGSATGAISALNDDLTNISSDVASLLTKINFQSSIMKITVGQSGTTFNIFIYTTNLQQAFYLLSFTSTNIGYYTWDGSAWVLLWNK